MWCNLLSPLKLTDPDYRAGESVHIVSRFAQTAHQSALHWVERFGQIYSSLVWISANADQHPPSCQTASDVCDVGVVDSFKSVYWKSDWFLLLTTDCPAVIRGNRRLIECSSCRCLYSRLSRHLRGLDTASQTPVKENIAASCSIFNEYHYLLFGQHLLGVKSATIPRHFSLHHRVRSSALQRYTNRRICHGLYYSN